MQTCRIDGVGLPSTPTPSTRKIHTYYNIRVLSNKDWGNLGPVPRTVNGVAEGVGDPVRRLAQGFGDPVRRRGDPRGD